jgi:hypothetical protein
VFVELNGDDVMRRFRLPRIRLAGRGEREPGDEHERLVLVAVIAGFVVVLAGIAGFVLFAAASGNGSAAPENPAIPSITDAGNADPTTTTEPAALPPPVTKPSAKPSTKPSATPSATPSPTRAEVAKPRPRPATPTSRPAVPTSGTLPVPGPGGGQVANPWDGCSPEGARASTPRFHLPMVCHDGRWHVVSSGHGGHDGHGHGDHGGHGRH